jgi:hypothetical protein
MRVAPVFLLRANSLGSTMARHDWVFIANVRAISDGLELLCEINGQRRGIPNDAIGSGSQVREPGDFGVLVVSREFAQRLGIAPV